MAYGKVWRGKQEPLRRTTLRADLSIPERGVISGRSGDNGLIFWPSWRVAVTHRSTLDCVDQPFPGQVKLETGWGGAAPGRCSLPLLPGAGGRLIFRSSVRVTQPAFSSFAS